MERDSVRPRGRRKLNRTQIVDILERNVALYKEETNFVNYLVDLALYLMEYEYDWSETVKPPQNTTTPNDTPVPLDGMGSRRLNSRVTLESRALNHHLCPHCGAEVGDLLLCPACHNITR